MRVLTSLQKRIARAVHDEILVTPKIDLVQANSLPKAEGKAVRVLDKRTTV
jgi:Coenzyme F390 synthetase